MYGEVRHYLVIAALSGVYLFPASPVFWAVALRCSVDVRVLFYRRFPGGYIPLYLWRTEVICECSVFVRTFVDKVRLPGYIHIYVVFEQPFVKVNGRIKILHHQVHLPRKPPGPLLVLHLLCPLI